MEVGVMPAEKIQVGNPNDPSTVTVGWHRDGGAVQLATLRPVHYPTEPPAGSPVDDGQYVDLSRQQINDLIRNLRRARDAAYGRDE